MINQKKKWLLPTVIVVAFTSSVNGFIGDWEAAVPTLVLPYGAREIAMGDVGVTIARGEVGSFWNPALLGVMDTSLRHGTAYYQFGKPGLTGLMEHNHGELKDNQSHIITLSYRSFKSSAGGFSLSVNHQFLGPQSRFDETAGNAYETIYGLTWGFGFQEIGMEDHTFGMTAKYIRSVIAPGLGDDGAGIGNTVAFDLGYLWKINSMFSAGLNLSNMGAHIFYISKSSQDPLPFKGNIAVGFQKNMTVAIVPLQVTAEYKASRYFVRNRYNGAPDPFYKAISTSWKDNSNRENRESILHNFGYEITVFDHFHLRQGFYIDNRFDVDDKEMHWGFGGTFLNHFSLDFYHIFAPRGKSTRHAAWGLSGTVVNFGKWN